MILYDEIGEMQKKNTLFISSQPWLIYSETKSICYFGFGFQNSEQDYKMIK